MPDADLLREYAATTSPVAFEKLVREHIDLVYSAARRQTRDPHLADDVTQAVFLILSKKARTIRDAATLPGWLVRTTRYAAFNAVRMAERRRRHEAQAAAMTSKFSPSDDTANVDHLVPALDEHLAQLSELDRTAIVLRYFQNKSVRDIAHVLNVSEAAAQKRVVRALEKLRNCFARRGRAASLDSMTAALAALPLIHAPAALGPAIVSSNLGANAVLIAKAAVQSMFWSGAKVATAAAVAAGIIVTSGSVLLLSDRPGAAHATSPSANQLATKVASPPEEPRGASTTTAPSRAPAQFPNIQMGVEPAPPGYAKGIDDTVKRTPGSDPAAVLMSVEEKPSRMGFTRFWTAALPYRGQRIRVSGYVKTENVAHWAGVAVDVFSSAGRIFAHDDMANRPISGTSDWKRFDSVVDVPAEADRIIFGVVLYHTGKVWADGFTITPVGKEVATTDDQHWHVFSWRASAYSCKVDATVRRYGRPTTMFYSAVPGVRTPEWANYDYALRDVGKYLGKRVRLTMWLKSERVTSGSGPKINVHGANFQKLSDEGQRGKRPVIGTTDWKRYEAVADVPEDAQVIYPGITMNGGGKIWVDDVKLEIVP